MSFRKMQFKIHGNGHDRGPLRKIVDYRTILFHGVKVGREVLECGHMIPTRKDFVGETNAARRRCGKCKLGHPKDV